MSDKIIQFDDAMFESKLDALVRVKVEHRVDDPLDLLSHHGVELGLEHGLVELYDFLGHGSVPLSNRGFSLSGD